MIRKLLLASIIIVGCTVPCLTKVNASTLQNSAKVNLVQQSDSSPSFLIADDERIERKYKNGRGDPHGRGQDLPSLERQLAELRKHGNHATTRSEKAKITQKIKNIQRAIAKARKGDTHGRAGRGQQR